jgi:hypothetical protein
MLFCVRWTLAFGFLMAPWPGVASAYGDAYRWCVNALPPSLWLPARVQFTSIPSSARGNDTGVEASVVRGRVRIQRKAELNSMLQGYLPIAFTMSLAIATPIAWSRRLRVIAWASASASAYVLVRAALFVPLALSGSAPDAIYMISPYAEKLREAGTWIVLSTLVGDFGIPLAIWAILVWLAAPEGTRAECTKSRARHDHAARARAC